MLKRSLVGAILLSASLSTVAWCQPAKPIDVPSTTAASTAPLCTIVLVYDDTCKTACVQVRGVVHDLAEKYSGKVKYVELNIAAASFKESVKTARDAGKAIYSFMSDSTGTVPDVGIFDRKQKLVRELVGAKKPNEYMVEIEKAFTTGK